MNRFLAGGVAGALAATGVVAFALPGLAQGQPQYEEFQGEADVEPLQPHPGEQVRVFDDTCFDGTTDLWWALRPVESSSAQEIGQVPLAGDGRWEVTFIAPDEAGDYLFFALCLPPGVDEPTVPDIDRVRDEDIPVEILEAWGVDALLYYAHLVPVVDDDGGETPPTTPPSTTTTVPATHEPAPTRGARPATPVPARPTFTG